MRFLCKLCKCIAEGDMWSAESVVSRAIRVFNVWRHARILAARVVGENTSGVFAHFSCTLPECWQRQSDCRIINITSQRAQTKIYVLRCMHAVLTWLTDSWLTPKLESARQ